MSEIPGPPDHDSTGPPIPDRTLPPIDMYNVSTRIGDITTVEGFPDNNYENCGVEGHRNYIRVYGRINSFINAPEGRIWVMMPSGANGIWVTRVHWRPPAI